MNRMYVNPRWRPFFLQRSLGKLKSKMASTVLAKISSLQQTGINCEFRSFGKYCIGKFISNIFSCPRGWGISCYFPQNISPHGGAFVSFCTPYRTNPHLYPRVGGVRVYFDWCIMFMPVSSKSLTASGEANSVCHLLLCDFFC